MRDIYSFKKIDQKEFIVGGIVARSDIADSQGDIFSEKTVWEMMKDFMLGNKYFKVEHKGGIKNVPIVECFFIENGDTYKGGSSEEHRLKRGDWWISCYLGDSENRPIFEKILNGELTSFSMAGSGYKG